MNNHHIDNIRKITDHRFLNMYALDETYDVDKK